MTTREKLIRSMVIEFFVPAHMTYDEYLKTVKKSTLKVNEAEANQILDRFIENLHAMAFYITPENPTPKMITAASEVAAEAASKLKLNPHDAEIYKLIYSTMVKADPDALNHTPVS